jgi:MerR family transcriptional regulator, light-induced transcriptional regulator
MASTGLNIAALARRTGVRPDTLRKWEQRYGILRPERTPGGQRRYGDADVARVEWLKARLGEGYRIGEAATLLGASTNRAVGRSAEELRDGIVAALDRADADAVEQLLDQALLVFPLEQALEEVVSPTLRTVGERWEAGRFSVAQEHLYSAAVRVRLERLLADARAPVRGVAVLACAPGELHDIGLLTIAVGLRADGWRVAYLGPATPYADALELADRLGARVLCLSATTEERAAELERSAGETPPGPATVVVGGAAMNRARARRIGARYVDGEVGAVVRRLRRLAA